MIGFIIFIIAAIVVLYFITQVKHMHNRFTLILIGLLLLFLYISASVIISKNKIEVKSFQGMVIAGEAYFKWLGHVFDNTKTIMGNAIKLDWGPGTNIDSTPSNTASGNNSGFTIGS